MNCVICRNGTTSDGLATVTLQRGSSTIIIKSVPAQICDNCGEYYLSDEVAESVLRIAEKATDNNPEVEILQYAA